jgi:hypothetical protein
MLIPAVFVDVGQAGSGMCAVANRYVAICSMQRKRSMEGWWYGFWLVSKNIALLYVM